MCGRFNVTSDPLTRFALRELGIQEPYPGLTAYNFAPEDATIVRARDASVEWATARWWLVPYWAREPSSKYAMLELLVMRRLPAWAKGDNSRERSGHPRSASLVEDSRSGSGQDSTDVSDHMLWQQVANGVDVVIRGHLSALASHLQADLRAHRAGLDQPGVDQRSERVIDRAPGVREALPFGADGQVLRT